MQCFPFPLSPCPITSSWGGKPLCICPIPGLRVGEPRTSQAREGPQPAPSTEPRCSLPLTSPPPAHRTPQGTLGVASPGDPSTPVSPACPRHAWAASGPVFMRGDGQRRRSFYSRDGSCCARFQKLLQTPPAEDPEVEMGSAQTCTAPDRGPGQQEACPQDPLPSPTCPPHQQAAVCPGGGVGPGAALSTLSLRTAVSPTRGGGGLPMAPRGLQAWTLLKRSPQRKPRAPERQGARASCPGPFLTGPGPGIGQGVGVPRAALGVCAGWWPAGGPGRLRRLVDRTRLPMRK